MGANLAGAAGWVPTGASWLDGELLTSTSGCTVVARTNLCLNPTFTSGVAGWTLVAAGTWLASFGRGVLTLSAPVTAQAPLVHETTAHPYVQGSAIAARVKVACSRGGTVFRIVLVGYNSADAEIAGFAYSPSTFVSSPGQMVEMVLPGAVIQDAACAAYRISVETWYALSSGDSVYFDDVLVEEDAVVGSDPGPYFDGSTPSTQDIAYSWTGGPNLSTSLMRVTTTFDVPFAIPIMSGRLSAVTSSKVLKTLTFTVPESVDGYSWVPGGDPTHPLARFGQQIDLGIDITSAVTGEVDHTRLGRFQVHDWAWDDLARTVSVTCLGVLSSVQEARFLIPEVPRPGGTLGSEFCRLMVAGVPVQIDGGLVDRACPRSFQWPQERLDALYEIADAWPARLRTDSWGEVNLLPPLPAVPVPTVFLTDGEGGTLVSAPRVDTREGLCNVVVGSSSATDTTVMAPVTAVAQITTGPLAVTTDGTGYGTVVRYYSSPLVTTKAQVQAAANTILAEASRPAVVVTVQCVPDPRINLDDAVSVTRGDDTWWGYVVAFELPLTIDGGLMRVDIGITS